MNLKDMLHESDEALLPLFARHWGVKKSAQLSGDELVDALEAAMLNPEQIEKVYDGLNDLDRGALQILTGAGSKMPIAMFSRMYGDIRKMGAGKIEREKPHENPQSVAESLFYKGFIGQTMDKVGIGLGPVVFVPEELAALLPTHKTGYDAASLEAEGPAETEADAPPAQVMILDEVEDIKPADTSIIDDMATVLAFVRVYAPPLDETNQLDEAEQNQLLPHLIHRDASRLSFLIGAGISSELIDVQGGKAYLRPEVRRWLENRRSMQLSLLAGSWRDSAVYRDLWHTPGLHPEPTGWPFDPIAAREAVLDMLKQLVPRQEWWSIEDFISAVKEENPDFQRPGGDYDSWYIRNDAGDYLNGFESWDAVEGALLEFYIMGPMHWLGLVDLAEDAARLTAYGRAFLDENQTWPDPTEPEDRIVVQAEGKLLASRKVSRWDRFQLARFTSWQSSASLSGDPYVYQLDAAGIRRADKQGINTGHISAFIGRVLDGAPVPPHMAHLLETWRSGPTASASMERLIVLRTTAPETLEAIMKNPALRRYLGAPLGPMAVVVRADQWENLRDALGEQGIEVDLLF
jgi:hypothetical protein